MKKLILCVIIFFQASVVSAACMDWVTHLREYDIYLQEQNLFKNPLYKHVQIPNSNLEVAYPRKQKNTSIKITDDGKRIQIDQWTILELDENNKCKNVSVLDPFSEEPGDLKYYYYDWSLCQDIIKLNPPRDNEELKVFVSNHQAEFDSFIQRALSAPFSPDRPRQFTMANRFYTPHGGPYNLVYQCYGINSSTASQAEYYKSLDSNIPD